MSQSSARVKVESNEAAAAPGAHPVRSARPDRGVLSVPGAAPEASGLPVSSAPPELPGTPGLPVAGVAAWIIAWVELVLLGFLAVIGSFFASAAASPGDYTCGLTLALAAIALAFVRLKSRFDGAAGDLASFLLVDDWPNLVAVIIVFVIVGLAGLFMAAAVEYGGLHNAGIALFLASGIAVFLNLKHVFDNLERHD